MKRSWLHLVPELLLHLPFALHAEFERDDLGRAVTDAMGDVVAGDVQDLPVIGHAADDDVAVRVAGVVVIDRDPIELRLQVALHLRHEPARHVAKVAQLGAVLGRHDKPELVAVVLAPVEELRSVRVVLEGRVEPAALAVERRAVALQVAEMGKGSLAARAAQLHHPRLDHDAARPVAHAAFGEAPAMLAREGGRELRTPTACVEPAGPRRGAPRPPDPARIAAGTRDRAIDLLEEGQRPARPAIATAARTAHARLEAEIVVAAHAEDIRQPIGPRKEPPTATRKAPARSKVYGKSASRGPPHGATLAP